MSARRRAVPVPTLAGPALVCGALLTVAPPAGAQRGPVDTVAIRAQLDSARRALLTAQIAHDSAGMARAFAPNPVIEVPGPGTTGPFAPTVAVARYIASWKATGQTTATIDATTVRVTSDSTASEEGVWAVPGGGGPYRLRWQRGPDRRWVIAEFRVVVDPP